MDSAQNKGQKNEKDDTQIAENTFEMNGHFNDVEREQGTDDEMDENDDIEFIETPFSICVKRIEDTIHGFVSEYSEKIRLGVYAVLLACYLFYFGYCMNYRFGDEGSIILLVMTVFLLWKVILKILDHRGVVVGLPQSIHSYFRSKHGRKVRKIVRYLAYIVATVAMVMYLAIDVFAHDITNLQSFLGMLCMILICFIISRKPSRVNWYPVFWSFVIQLVLAYFTLRTRIGRDAFDWLGDLVTTFFNFSDDGSAFVFGKDFKTWGLAFSTSGVIIFTSACIFLLNQWGVIEFVVLKLGGFLGFCLETGPVESIVAAGNIFLTLTEAPLMVQAYLPTITKSELHTIITCGFASISGSALGIFVALGAPANHLLTASVISAPAALAISKLMYPETERVVVRSQSNIKIGDGKKTNSLSAFSDGAIMAVGVCASIWSNMLVFVSMISLLDALVGWFGDRAGIDDLTFTMICSYVLYPLAFLMGVDVSDCRKFGELMGIKLFATPFISYKQLGDLIQNRVDFESYRSSINDTAWHWQGDDIFLEITNTTLKGGILAERTEVIATYAMCGLSAFSAIGISLGTLVPLCRNRKHDIVDVVVGAFIAGNMASFATGAIAGILYTPDG